MIRIVLLLWGLLLVLQPAPEDTFAEANAAYTAGDYARAVTLYEGLLAQGINAGVVYYNLGCAYYQSGDPGRALLNYRRAQRQMPRDADVQAALLLVRSQRLESFDGAPTGDLFVFAGEWLLSAWTVDELLLAALVGWSAFWGGIIWLLEHRGRLRTWFAAGLVVLLLLTIGLVGSVIVVQQSPAAVVVAPLVPVMSGPAESYLELYQLQAAAEVRVLAVQDDWLRIVLPNGRQGWLLADSVALV